MLIYITVASMMHEGHSIIFSLEIANDTISTVANGGELPRTIAASP
jgi:hypothetical protein